MSVPPPDPSSPPPPVKPRPEDCCGHDCAVCVFDLYDQELTIWEKECERWRREARRSALSTTTERVRSTSPALETEAYRDFLILALEKSTPGVIEILLQPVKDHVSPLAIGLGQHLVVRGVDVATGTAFSRQLTPFDVDEEGGTFRLMIKLKPWGRLSAIAGSWKVGDALALRGPLGGLAYRPNQFSKIWMLAIGVGIAPLLSYITAILDDEEEDTMISLHYGNRRYEDVCQKSKLDQWSSYWNFQVTHYLSGETEETLKGKRKYGEKVETSRLDADMVRKAICGGPNSDGRDEAVFIVGSPDFEINTGDAISDLFKGGVFRFTNLT